MDTTRPRFRRSPFLFRSLPFFGRDSRHRTRAEQKSGAGCTGILIGERAPAKRVLKCRFYRRQSAYTDSLSGSPSHRCVSLARSTNNPIRISSACTYSRCSFVIRACALFLRRTRMRVGRARFFRQGVRKGTKERTRAVPPRGEMKNVFEENGQETPTLERREATTHAIHLYPRETRGVRFLNDRYLNYYLEYFFSNGEDNSFGGGKEGKGVSAERQKREAARGRSKVHRLRPVHP